MRTFFLIALFLFNLENAEVLGQYSGEINCNNGPFHLDNYMIPSVENKVKLEIKKDGNWHSYLFLKGTYPYLEANCSLKELVDGKPEELIIRWNSKTIGSGGVIERKGIQIWSLKSHERYFKAKTYCSEANFGRHGADRYFINCKRKIEISEGVISISRIKCENEGDWQGKTRFCKIYSIKPGNYELGSTGLEYLNASSYLMDNETALLEFKTENGKRLVIAKDTVNNYLFYRFGTPNKIELEYPSDKKNSGNQFKFSYYFRGGEIQNEGVDFNYLYFKKGNYRYVVYQEYTARSKETKYGIKVINLKTKETTKIKAKPSTVEGSLGELRDNDKIKEGDKLFD